MTKLVLISNLISIYDDEPGSRYNFPNKSYLSTMIKSIGDWVVLYGSSRSDLPGYFAIQKIEKIVPDPVHSDRSYAIVEPGSFWTFENLVPRARSAGRLFESSLALTGGNNASAVRVLSDEDFFAICSQGHRPLLDADAIPRDEEFQTQDILSGFGEARSPFLSESEQDRSTILVSRTVREASFARQVKRAYRGTCAISGLELRNGGGRPEVEAAHIKPVQERGPDTVQNGIALSGTIHWMFDRGLISVDHDNSLLVAKGTIADQAAARLFLPERKVLVPDSAYLAPHPAFLKWHRENVFKG